MWENWKKEGLGISNSKSLLNAYSIGKYRRFWSAGLLFCGVIHSIPGRVKVSRAFSIFLGFWLGFLYREWYILTLWKPSANEHTFLRYLCLSYLASIRYWTLPPACESCPTSLPFSPSPLSTLSTAPPSLSSSYRNKKGGRQLCFDCEAVNFLPVNLLWRGTHFFDHAKLQTNSTEILWHIYLINKDF